MNALDEYAHVLLRNSRRLRGVLAVQRMHADGDAPAAVERALRSALYGRPSEQERAWVRRIEWLRGILLTSDEPMSDGRTIGKMTLSSKHERWAYLLFRLVRELRPETTIELGSCVGISGSYLSAGMELNGAGRLITLEGLEQLAGETRFSFQILGLQYRTEVVQGFFHDTLAGVLDGLHGLPLQLVFIDGHHQEQATYDYMEQILPHLADEAVIVFDEIHYSEGMERAWKTIRADKRFAMTVDLKSTSAVGIAVVSKSATRRSTMAIPYY